MAQNVWDDNLALLCGGIVGVHRLVLEDGKDTRLLGLFFLTVFKIYVH